MTWLIDAGFLLLFLLVTGAILSARAEATPHEVMAATSPAANAPLSGIFFIRARNTEHAFELAKNLPHLKHGGQVLVQKTIPTDSPPDP